MNQSYLIREDNLLAKELISILERDKLSITDYILFIII